jgi:hypothetical protein
MRWVEGKKKIVRSLTPPILAKPDKGYIDSKPSYWMLIAQVGIQSWMD